MLPDEKQHSHDGSRRRCYGARVLGIVQPYQPRLPRSKEPEAVLGLLGCLGNVVLGVGEALGVGAVHDLEVVEDGEYWDGGELVSDRLQPLPAGFPKLRANVNNTN